MGGLLSDAVDGIASFTGLDAFNNDKTSKGSTFNTGAKTQSPEESAAALDAQRRAWQQQQWQAQEDKRINDAAWEERKGFLTSMMPPSPGDPQAPQGGWGYQPGKGATWMTPNQPGPAQPGAAPAQPAWSAAPGNSPFTGNRI